MHLEPRRHTPSSQGCCSRYDELDGSVHKDPAEVDAEAGPDAVWRQAEAALAEMEEGDEDPRAPYFTNGWNVLDFFIVLVGFLEFIPSFGNGSSAIRALRVLRPLRAVNKLKSLKVIVTTLLNTLPDLLQVGFILLFLFIIFAITGVQLFNGLLHQRCVDDATGELLEDGEFICSTVDADNARTCPTGASCRPVGENLGNGIVHFDNFGNALLTMYLVVDMSGWAEIMYAVQDAAGKTVWIFFVAAVLLGAFFAMNLVLAVVVEEFESTSNDADDAEALASEKAALKQQLERLRSAQRAAPQTLRSVENPLGLPSSGATEEAGVTGSCEAPPSPIRVHEDHPETGVREPVAGGELETQVVGEPASPIRMHIFRGKSVDEAPSSSSRRLLKGVPTLDSHPDHGAVSKVAGGALNTHMMGEPDSPIRVEVFKGDPAAWSATALDAGAAAGLQALQAQPGPTGAEKVVGGELHSMTLKGSASPVRLFIFRDTSTGQASQRPAQRSRGVVSQTLHPPPSAAMSTQRLHGAQETAPHGHLDAYTLTSGGSVQSRFYVYRNSRPPPPTAAADSLLDAEGEDNGTGTPLPQEPFVPSVSVEELVSKVRPGLHYDRRHPSHGQVQSAPHGELVTLMLDGGLRMDVYRQTAHAPVDAAPARGPVAALQRCPTDTIPGAIMHAAHARRLGVPPSIPELSIIDQLGQLHGSRAFDTVSQEAMVAAAQPGLKPWRRQRINDGSKDTISPTLGLPRLALAHKTFPISPGAQHAAYAVVRDVDASLALEREWLVGKPEWVLAVNSLVNSAAFRGAILLAIIANTILLAMDFNGIDSALLKQLETGNLVLTGIFAAEMALKLVGLGIKGYARDAFNLFDGFVVIVSLIEIAASQGSGGGVVSVLRTFRLIRILKLLKQFPALRVLLNTIAASLPDISWMALLMCLFVFIFGVLGMQLFAGQVAALDSEPVFTFETLGDALLTAFVLITNDDWDNMMFDGVKCCGDGAVAFFLLGQILGMYIVLSLFIAILLRRFAGQDDSTLDGEDMHSLALELRQKEMAKAPRNEAFAFTPPHAVAAAVLLRGRVLRKQRARAHREQKKRHERVVPTGMTGYACGLGPPDAPLRVALHRLVTSTAFEVVILLLILLNCVFLALERPTRPEDDPLAVTIRGMDVFFAVVFTLEMVAKCIAHGLWMPGGRGYFRSYWNWLDAFVVLVSIVSLAAPQFAIARALRALRPLRVVVRSDNIKVVINALIAALPNMGNVVVLASLLWLIFAIMGTNLFKGVFYECSDPSIDLRSQCVDGLVNETTPVLSPNGTVIGSTTSEVMRSRTWQPIEGTEHANFDNVGNSMLLLFQVASLSGWGEVMHLAIAARGDAQAPAPKSNPAAALYFIAFVIIGGFFVINLAVGVIIDNFNRLKGIYDGSAFLTKEQKRWYTTNRLISSATSELSTFADAPSQAWRKPFYDLSTAAWFDTFIMAAIIFNTFLMMLQHYQQPQALTDTLAVFNIMFIIIFALEVVIKVLGTRGAFPAYWADGWNKFDFIVVILSFVSLASPAGGGANVIRVFRVARVFRLIKRAKTLRRLFQTLVLSLPSLLNISALLGVLYFMFAVLGVSLFGSVDTTGDGGLNRHANFYNFPEALELVWVVSTGDAWEQPMYAAMAATSPAAALYFIAVQLILSFVFLQLFIAVILEQFSDDLEAEFDQDASDDEDEDDSVGTAASSSQGSEASLGDSSDGEESEASARPKFRWPVPKGGPNRPRPEGWTNLQSLQEWARVWNRMDRLATRFVRATLFNRLMAGAPPPFGFGTPSLDRLEIMRRAEVFNIPIVLVPRSLVKRQPAVGEGLGALVPDKAGGSVRQSSAEGAEGEPDSKAKSVGLGAGKKAATAVSTVMGGCRRACADCLGSCLDVLQAAPPGEEADGDGAPGTPRPPRSSMASPTSGEQDGGKKATEGKLGSKIVLSVDSRRARRKLVWSMGFEPTLKALARVALSVDITDDFLDAKDGQRVWRLHEYLAVRTLEWWWLTRGQGEAGQGGGRASMARRRARLRWESDEDASPASWDRDESGPGGSSRSLRELGAQAPDSKSSVPRPTAMLPPPAPSPEFKQGSAKSPPGSVAAAPPERATAVGGPQQPRVRADPPPPIRTTASARALARVAATPPAPSESDTPPEKVGLSSGAALATLRAVAKLKAGRSRTNRALRKAQAALEGSATPPASSKAMEACVDADRRTAAEVARDATASPTRQKRGAAAAARAAQLSEAPGTGVAGTVLSPRTPSKVGSPRRGAVRLTLSPAPRSALHRQALAASAAAGFSTPLRRTPGMSASSPASTGAITQLKVRMKDGGDSST